MERDGRLMAQAKTTALTKKIDAMLDSWQEYTSTITEIWVCTPCRDGACYMCRDGIGNSECHCECHDDEYVQVIR